MKRLKRERGRSLASAVSDGDILYEYATRWSFQAHPGQIPPRDKQWFCYLMRSGRGGGKTRAGAEWILQRVREGYKHIALIGQTSADIRDTMVEIGPSSIMKIARPEERPVYEPSKRRLTFPNGAIATTFTGEEPDQLRGPAHDTVWIDELAKFKYPDETWDNMEMGLRLGDNPQVFVTTTPRPIPIIRKIVADTSTVDVRFSTSQNADNLSQLFIQRMNEKYGGTRLGRQELEGEILDDNPNALWQREVIENLRHTGKLPVLTRIVIGVDPAVTSAEGSDETGIVAAGIAASGHCYVLEDASLQGTPNQWAVSVSRTFHKHKADRVIGEVNNGGDLVETNLRTVDRNISFRAVHASRGKLIRAEPIAALYEQGKVHHCGTFPQLEDQMCEWVPGEKSPDRMDALVWAITELSSRASGKPVILGSTRKW
jgi:phage terminase large subunit-like protein